MKISVLAPFPKYKDGIPRAAEELISRLCEAENIESVTIMAAKKERDFASLFLLSSEKVSLFVVGSFFPPWTPWGTIKLNRLREVVLFSLACLLSPSPTSGQMRDLTSGKMAPSAVRLRPLRLLGGCRRRQKSCKEQSSGLG